MRKEIFAEDNYYHLYSRGTEKRVIFIDDRDRIRFLHTLYILNNFILPGGHFDFIKLEPRDSLTKLVGPYVEIVAGCLMPTHYHLMLTPKKENGVSQFLQKIGTSYTKYFNTRHERTGRLFESTFKAKHVDKYEYASYLTQYIHLNPVELLNVKLEQDLLGEITRYPWSSLPEYLGLKSEFSLLVSSSFREEVLGLNVAEYRKLLKETISLRSKPQATS